MSVAWLLLVVLALIGAWHLVSDGVERYRRTVAQAEDDVRGGL